jgi:DNA-binding IclR family transcriptional regulator
MRKTPRQQLSTPKYPVKSLEKALAVLKLLNEGERDLSLTEIAESLGLWKGTVHRILDTLKAFEFVHQDPSNLRYGLGLQKGSRSAAQATLCKMQRGHQRRGSGT